MNFLQNLKKAIENDDIEETKYLLCKNLHELKDITDSIMNFCFNSELANLVWSFLEQPNFDVNELSFQNPAHASLTLATYLEQPEIVKLLLKIPSLDVNISDAELLTSLQIACESENFEVTKL